MSFLDMFKKKDDFDSLLKEPEGGNWDEGNSDLGISNDDILGQPLGSDPLLGQSSNELGGIPNPSAGSMAQSPDVMGLPSQSSDMGLGSDGDIPSFDSGNSFSSESTSASALNLNTNYPSNQTSSQNRNPPQNNYQVPAEEQFTGNNANNAIPGNDHQIDLILTKLDLLKSTLQNLDNRLYHIEKKLFEEPNNRNTW